MRLGRFITARLQRLQLFSNVEIEAIRATATLSAVSIASHVALPSRSRDRVVANDVAAETFA